MHITYESTRTCILVIYRKFPKIILAPASPTQLFLLMQNALKVKLEKLCRGGGISNATLCLFTFAIRPRCVCAIHKNSQGTVTYERSK